MKNCKPPYPGWKSHCQVGRHYNLQKTYYQRNADILVNIELESEINELFAKTKVIQKFTNPLTDNPLELKIYVHKKEGLLFSSFSSKIGDSITVKSKVVKKEKAEEKYLDTISKGNAAIFISDDPENKNRIIINMGNIPPKEEVIFTSEFIHPIEFSKKSYEFELFRNFPIFDGDGVRYANSQVKGEIHIKMANKLLITEKEILMKNLKITTKKYENKKRNSYIIKYEIDKLPEFSPYNLDYIPSSKIYFKAENDYEKPVVYSQKSILNKNNNNYFIQYNIKTKKIDEEQNTEENPALFIFLIDQSGSMSGAPMKIASSALKLFIQSLPSKSYYQIIGFGSTFVKYDKSPKEYTKKNIDESLEQIDKLKTNLGGTNIYDPLKDIYDSYELYDKIDLPKNIFLLTDGEILNKDKTLEIIEKNSTKFVVYSIGIGNAFDKDLIKNAGILGKGSYNFCCNINQLNKAITEEINKAISPFISNLTIKTSLDKNNIIKINDEHIPNIIREGEVINLSYITNNNKKEEKEEKVKIEIKYLENGKSNEETYEIIPLEILEGEEFSKLIINNYLLKNSNLSEKEKIKLALKYQILTNDTSLFAEVELSEKVSEDLKTKIIGDKKNNRIYKPHIYCDNDYYENMRIYGRREKHGRNYKNAKAMHSKDIETRLLYGNNIANNLMNRKRERDLEEEEAGEEENLSNLENIINLEEKEKVMKILRTQDFNKGNWDENNETKKIKEKYIKEYNLLKGLKDKKINDSIAMTIIIIYFIYKEYHELLSELSRIIQKAKNFIRKETNTSYEKIIKEIGI